MCLIVFGYKIHPRSPFVLAANRDEFYNRPTAPAAFWTDAPQVLAGRDLAAGGTWLGVTRTKRFAAVTNYREPFARAGNKSRGRLTADFLIGGESPEQYLRRIQIEKDGYSGFNLLVGDFESEESRLFYFSNRADEIRELPAGIYGLSNALLDTDWHKVEQTKIRFEKVLRNADGLAAADLFDVLADREFAPDERLPQTGVGSERERVLSPAFIETENYGTRCSTVLIVGRDGAVDFHERTFVGETSRVSLRFKI